MTPPRVSDRALQTLSHMLLERVGLRAPADPGSGLRLALQARMEALGEHDAESYVARLQTEGAELRALLPLVTVGKTEFFRDATQFRALREVVLPELLARSRREMRQLRVWSAGCATGEEPYSLAMVLDELGVEPAGADLLATDVNPQAVEVASCGHFAARRMAGIAHGLLARHFTHRGGEYDARPELRERIRFAAHNLAGPGPYPAPAQGMPWDLILCRNVLIYFDRVGMVRVLRRFHDALSEGGYLCLGYSESLFRVSVDFELTEVHGAFLYRRPTPRPLRRTSREQPHTPAKQTEAPRPKSAATRVTPRHVPRITPRQVPKTPPPADLAAVPDPLERVTGLMEKGRFEQATQLLEEALAHAPSNLALCLTHGNAMLILRRLEEARSDYRRALVLEPLCAEAHLFLGIACAEDEGRELREEGAREVGRALFLDPKLALAHYWAGRLAERSGDKDAARRSYRNAVEACKGTKGSAPLIGHVPDLPADPALLARAARYALAALEEHGHS